MSTSPPLVVADRYRLVAPLGQGGMGRVWRATDVVLHRDVAIKELVPPPGLTPDERQEMRERSLREARAIARLNNINVVRVFDVLRTDADPWIVMEYVPSRSLQDILAADGPLPPVRAAEVGLGVLNALRAAHRNGVVHRDVKPGNVLIGEDGRVVLTDFGLATVPGDPNVTRTGLVLGSPAYIAPERARDGTAGPGADLWSLGATLYAAVEGASPFARPSAIATLAALATENPPPSRNAGPLKPVLNGLLRKDPAHRINAEEAERLLLRATGRRSKLTFPMSPTMRRPGIGRERPALPGTPPVIPGSPTVSGSAPVVPGPRPPVSTGRPPATGRPAASGRPPAQPDDGRRPPVFVPGKASVGRTPRPPADNPTKIETPRLDATRVDTPPIKDIPGTGRTSPPVPTRPGPEASDPSPPNSAHGALARGTRGAFGTISAAEVAAHRGRRTDAPAPAASAAVPVADAPTASATPVTDAPAPIASAAVPVADAQAPTASAAVPVTDAPAPTASAAVPVTDAPAPTASAAVPVVDRPKPATERQADRATSAGPADRPATQPSADRSPVGEPPTRVTAVGPSGTTSSPHASPVATTPEAAGGPITDDGAAEAAASKAEPASPTGTSESTKPATDATTDAGKAAETGTAAPHTAAPKTEPGDAPATDRSAAEADEPAAATASSAAATPKTDADEPTATSATPPAGNTTPAEGDAAPAATKDSEEASRTGSVRKPAVGARAGAGKSSRKKGRGRNTPTPKATPAAEAKAATDDKTSTATSADDAPKPAQSAEPASSVASGAVAAAAEPAGSPSAATAAEPATAPASAAIKTADKAPTEPSPTADNASGESSSTVGEASAELSSSTSGKASDESASTAGKVSDESASTAGKVPAASTAKLDTSAAAEATKAAITGAVKQQPARKPAPKTATKARSGDRATTASVTAAKSESPAGTAIIGVPAARTGDTATGTTAPRRGSIGIDGTRVLDTGPTRTGSTSAAPVPGFPASRRPAWQPMAVPPQPASKRGVTVFGTTLTRRQTAIGIALLVGVLLALVLLVPRAFGDDGANDDADRAAGPAVPPAASARATTAATSAAAAPPPATTQPATSAPPSSAPPTTTAAAPADTVPAGFYLYKDSTGFSVPLPNGWRADRRGSEVYFDGGDRLLIIDQTDQPKSDPVADWKAQEAERRGSTYRNYQPIRIEAVKYFTKAADWEFRYTTSRGNPQHAQKRGFITAPNKAYGISFYTSPGEWDANKKVLETIYNGFKPAKS